jgi:hypothetical protein
MVNVMLEISRQGGIIRVIHVLKMASHSEATQLRIRKVYTWLITYQ